MATQMHILCAYLQLIESLMMQESIKAISAKNVLKKKDRNG